MFLLFACVQTVQEAPEAEGRPDLGEPALALAEGELTLSALGATLRHGDRVEVLAVELVQPPTLSERGDRLLLNHRDGGVVSAIDAWALEDGAWTRRRVTDAGAPDRAALSPDGEMVAWVAAPDGLAALFVAPFRGGEPIQLTNQDLVRVPGQEPEGWVEPPTSPPWFEPGFLVWDQGRVALP